MEYFQSYQDAKIANPESEIYLWGNGFVAEKDIAPSHNTYEYRGFTKCNPADYCMTLADFLEAGHLLAVGDAFIGLAGGVVEIGCAGYIADFANVANANDKNRYILRAAALEGKMGLKDGDDRNELKPSCRVEFDTTPPQVDSLGGKSEWDGLNGFSFLCKNGNIIELNIPPEFKDGIIKISNGKIEVLR